MYRITDTGSFMKDFNDKVYVDYHFINAYNFIQILP